MTRPARLGALLLGYAACLVMLSARSGPSTVTPEARGRYLVHNVAMCVQCHTPRDEKGDLLAGREFAGAPIPVRSPFPGRDWATQAPNLRGLTGLSDEQVVHLLCDGIAHTGGPPMPPMPPFRMSREDAEAIVAYLRTLP